MQMTLDIIDWVLTFSIISHDSILEEVMLISLEKAVIVWVSPASPQQISIFLLKLSDLSITFRCMKDFHKIWLCEILTAVRPSLHQGFC